MAWTAVGSLNPNGNNATSFSLTPSAVGNMMFVSVGQFANGTVYANSLSSSNVTWTLAGFTQGTAHGYTEAVFLGAVTVASAATVTIGWSGTAPPTTNMLWSGQEFHSTVGSWTVDQVGHLDSADTNTWASLTPAGNGELYVGAAQDNATAIGGTGQPAFTFLVDTNGNGLAYNLNCSAGTAYAPVWGDSSQAVGVMLMVAEGSGSSPPSPPPAPTRPPGRRNPMAWRDRQFSPPPPPQPAVTAVVLRQPRRLVRKPAMRLATAPQAPPVVVPVIRKPPPPPPRPRPRMAVTAAPAVPPVAVTPVTAARRPRLPVRGRGVVTGPLAPGAVAVVTPVRPVVLAAPRRGPPRTPASRLAAGTVPVLTVPPFTRSAARLARRAASRLVPAPFTAYPLSLPARTGRAPARLVRAPRSFFLAPGVPPPPSVTPARQRPLPARRQPRMTVITGMLPGAGLSGIPVQLTRMTYRLRRVTAQKVARGERGSLTVPVPVPVTLRNRQRVRPVTSRLNPPPYVPPGTVYPVNAFPARLARTAYRLPRQPRMAVVTGTLPGKGLSGIPPQPVRMTSRQQRKPAQALRAGIPGPPVSPAFTRGARPALPRQPRPVLRPGILPGQVPPALVLRALARRVRAAASRLVAGAFPLPPSARLTAPARRAPARAVPSRLIRAPYVPPPAYPVVTQQARLRAVMYRLARRQRGSLATGMLPGGAPPATGTAAWRTRPGSARWATAPALARWKAAPAPWRWKTRPGTGTWRIMGGALLRWTAAPVSPGGRAMASFTPVAAISLEEVNVIWQSGLDGVLIDPTGQTTGQAALPVSAAFPVSSGNQLAPSEPVTWYASSWLLGGTGIGYVAQTLVGPGGGVVTLTAGQAYDVWSKITGVPEVPAKFVGTLTVY